VFFIYRGRGSRSSWGQGRRGVKVVMGQGHKSKKAPRLLAGGLHSTILLVPLIVKTIISLYIVCSSLEHEDAPAPAAKGSHSWTWLERPLVSGDRSQLERHLVSEQCKRQQLEETLSLLLHQQQHLPSSMVSSSFGERLLKILSVLSD